MKSDNDNVLESNVSSLLEHGGDPPRLADGARARIRAHLIEKHGVELRRRSPLVAVGLGLAATAVAAFIVTRIVGGDDGGGGPIGSITQPDGSTWIVDTGGVVTVLGERHVRVEGAALLDVAPGTKTFVVETARGRIEVLGTRFLVAADRDRTTAAVVRGTVRLASTDGTVDLHAGEQGVLESGRPPTRGPAPRLSHLVSWAAAARAVQQNVKPLRNGTLFARDPNNPWVPESPLPIAKLGVDIVVENQVARVALDQTFYNPSERAMEGMYRFAIPPDAALQRLAMYVDGKLTESAVVERMQARRIYEEVVYRRLDPALLEWAGTGRLALRVYPLPARENKRLVLAYTQSLPKLYDDYSLTVPLPEVDLPVADVAFDVRVKGCASCELTSTSHKIAVARDGDDALVTVRQQAAKIGDSLVLHVRDARHAPVVATAKQDKDDYLLVRARPDFGRAQPTYRPRTWVILDDVSASRSPLELRAQTDLVDAFVHELDEDDKVAVIAFDVNARTKLAPTRVLDVDRKALRGRLAEEGGVGATDFGVALDAATKLLAGTPADDANIVYLGDGVVSSGARTLDALRAQIIGKAHFIGVGMGDGPDTQTLDALAAATGGYSTAIDLSDDLGWHAFDLVAALHTLRVTNLQARLVDATGALVPSTTYVKVPQIADGEELELVSKLAGSKVPASPGRAASPKGDAELRSGVPAAVELTGQLNGAAWTQKIALDKAVPNAGYLPRLWAQRHVAARLLAKHEPVSVPPCVITATATTRRVDAKTPSCPSERDLREERDEGIRKEVVALGKKYFLLSRHTSLLVLENDDMYARYGVKKGAGDTWAPYALPAKIATGPVPPPLPIAVADDAELVRTPMVLFDMRTYANDYDSLDYLERGDIAGARMRAIETARSAGVLGATRRELDLSNLDRGTTEDYEYKPQEEGRDFKADKNADAAQAQTRQPDDASERHGYVSSGEIADPYPSNGDGGGGERFAEGHMGKIVLGGGKMRGRGGRKHFDGTPIQYLGYPGEPAFDDLSAFVPALARDATEIWRKQLEQGTGGTAKHAFDAGARDLLARARKALPSGVYRWDNLEFAIDDARRIGWRRTTETELAETASYDGVTWTRRYAELGLDVTRTLGDDDVALAFAQLPIWIADPAHYARWFEVALANPHAVALSKTVKGKPEVQFTLEFDGSDHLIAIRDAKNKPLLTVTWGPAGPTAARTLEGDLSVGYTGQPIMDAIQWAMTSSAATVAVELPCHLPAYWTARLGKLVEGSPEWRHAQRQRMASLAAVSDRANLATAYDALRTHGGVELGDLTLASSALVNAKDADLAVALAPLKTQPVARYLAAGHAYRTNPVPERIKPETTDGMIGALWTLREISALAISDTKHATLAVDRLAALPARALELRVLAAGVVTRGNVAPEDAARAWDSVAIGDYRNLACVNAAQLLAARGKYDAAAARVQALVADLDLAAAPANLANVRYFYNYASAGPAGWQLVWSTWRDRVLARGNYDHVMSLMRLVGEHPLDVLPILTKAAALANGDAEKLLEVAQLGARYGHGPWAQALVEPLAKTQPSRALHQLLASFALSRGDQAGALAHLESAQEAGADEAVNIAVVRAEMRQIIQLARQLATQTSGTARQGYVQRALAWAKRWRIVDPGNAEIDQSMGDMLLATGNRDEAFRQLSTVIERDPMSGDGYQTVAIAFENQGRVADALEYWQQAIVIDQTNPTPRLRKARALIALGKIDDGDKLLAEIAGRRWHARWDSIVYETRDLIERRKTQH